MTSGAQTKRNIIAYHSPKGTMPSRTDVLAARTVCERSAAECGKLLSGRQEIMFLSRKPSADVPKEHFGNPMLMS